MSNNLFKYGVPITIDNSNNTSSASNTLTLKFQTPQYLNQDLGIALVKHTCFKSWNNITSAYGNNTIGYIWNNVSYNLMLPDGDYSVSDLNMSLQLFMYSNNHYLLDQNGNPYYFISIVEQPIYYCLYVNCIIVPSVLPNGYTNPNSITLNGLTPQLIMNNTKLASMLGLSVKNYPLAQQNTNYTFAGSTTNDINIVNNVYINCSLVNLMGLSDKPSMIYSYVPNVSNGEAIEEEPKNIIYYPILGGQYNSITFTMTDNNNQPLQILDPTKSITVIIKDMRNK